MGKKFVSYQGKLEKGIHKQAKRQAVESEITLIEYINSLIVKDLAEKGLLDPEVKEEPEPVKV